MARWLSLPNMLVSSPNVRPLEPQIQDGARVSVNLTLELEVFRRRSICHHAGTGSRSRSMKWIVAAASACVWVVPASAQDGDFTGKVLTIYIGNTAGGTY